MRPVSMSNVDASTRIFFDASCLIAAAASPSGGSGFIWRLCERGLLRAVVSQAVLIEAESNLSRKFGSDCLLRHRLQIQKGAPQIAAIPRLDSELRLYPGISPKDEHVVAAAHAADADFILTLDQPLADEIDRAALGVLVRSPGAFIRLDLPGHPAFASMRDG